MAVIQKTTVHIEGHNFKQVVKCSADGQFSINYPDDIALALGKTEELGATKDHVVSEWSKGCHAVLSAKVTKRRVICFEFKANCTISERIDEDGGYRWVDHIKRGDFSFAGGIAVGISAGVYIEERKDFPDGRVAYGYERVVHDEQLRGNIKHFTRGPSDGRTWNTDKPWDNLVDFSEDTFAFFQSMNDRLEQLALAIDDITSSPEALAIAVKNGVPMISGPTPSHTPPKD